MNKEFLTDTLVFLLAFTYCTIFWKERMGLNTLLFASLMTGCLILRYDVKQHPYFWLSAGGTMLTAMMVVWHNSLVSKIIFFSSMITMIGFAQQRVLRFMWYALLLGLYSMLETPRKFMQQFKGNFSRSFRPFALSRSFQVSFVPLLVIGLFYLIYYYANGKFAELSDYFWLNLWEIILEYFPLQRLMLFLIGGAIAGGALWESRFQFFAKKEAKHKENLSRYLKRAYRTYFKLLDFKKEYQQGMIVMTTLNLLLFIVNCIDVRYVWFNFEGGTAQEMKQYVHEGTYLLIAAILLAMSVLLVVFRGKVNFFSKNRWIKNLAYAWIAQNAILAFSVAIRNYRYIESYNLAYKRIGVFIFLTLVFIGLVTFFLKIKQRKTTYYLLHRNAIASYCIWLIVCCVNWDVFITRYNLSHADNGIDANFIIQKISDKNLFLIENEVDLLAEKDVFYSDYYHRDDIHLLLIEDLEEKRNRFNRKMEQVGWLSWNYADWRNLKGVGNK
ncbi:MAG: DUF4173 domain-containing protein [Bacteroidota bacterium]